MLLLRKILIIYRCIDRYKTKYIYLYIFIYVYFKYLHGPTSVLVKGREVQQDVPHHLVNRTGN